MRWDVPPIPPERALAADGLPDAPGLYAWWVTEPDALSDVPLVPRPEDGLCLLYIGISPRREGSSQKVRGRVARNHLAGNIGGSTFRLSLAALLFEREGWRPVWRGDRARLCDEAALSAWQRRHLRVQWAVKEQPWTIEREIIEAMQPPLNLAENAGHPFNATLKAARARLRAQAKSNGGNCRG